MASEHHARMAAEMKERLKVDELEDNIDDLEDVVEDVFPILILTVIISFFLLVLILLRLYMRWSVPNPSNNRMEGKTVLITGSTGGIGRATAVELAKRGARVFVTGRDLTRTEAVARSIRKKTGNQQVNARKLDLNSLQAIREFCAEFNKTEKYLHVLINNGAYMGPKTTTDDGLEKCFGVNYLSHFYLTHLLSDKLKKNAPARVINVVSASYSKGSLDLDDLALNKVKEYDIYGAYCRSKLAQVLLNVECHRQMFSSCVWFFGVHPGACNTELMREYPGMFGNALRTFSRFMFKSPEDGCQTIVYCAVADKIRGHSGKMFANCQVLKSSDKIVDKTLAKDLWKVSAQLCGFEANLPEEHDNIVPNGTEEKVEQPITNEEITTEDKKSQ